MVWHACHIVQEFASWLSAFGRGIIMEKQEMEMEMETETEMETEIEILAW